MKIVKPNVVPRFRVHKATGQGYVNLDGRRVYLGRADLPEAKQRYARAVAESGANGGRRSVPQAELTVVELVNAFRRHCEEDSIDKRELDHLRSAWTPVVKLYGDMPAAAFGPLKLKAVRERLIVCGKRPQTRQYVNRLVERVRFIFRWAVGEELLPVAAYEALRAVPGLKRNKTDAAESEPVKPVPDAHIDAIRPYLSRQVAALIDLQLLTAARPGELVIMRSIETSTAQVPQGLVGQEAKPLCGPTPQRRTKPPGAVIVGRSISVRVRRTWCVRFLQAGPWKRSCSRPLRPWPSNARIGTPRG